MVGLDDDQMDVHDLKIWFFDIQAISTPRKSDTQVNT
jgi:hypothetical protein